MSLTEIKAAISELTPRERAELMYWLHPSEDDDWDRQMKADIEAGKLDDMTRAAEEAYRRGECRPFP